MNWLDRSIGWVSPSAGLRRQKARTAMEMLGEAKRLYEGASAGRRTDGWVTHSSDANSEIGAAQARLRSRARDLVRNNPWAAHAVKSLASNVVGRGIYPRADDRTDLVWARWAETADAAGQTDFYGLQSLVVRTMVEAGSVLVRLRPRLPRDELIVPFQLEVLEPDYLDTTKNAVRDDGTRIEQGIEFDALGRRRGYWLYNQHPGGSGLGTSYGSRFIPANEMLHIYEPLRAGQVNGVTWFAPAIVKMRDLDEYDEAELVRKKIEACLAAFVTTDEDSITLGSAQVNPETGQRVESFEPGMVAYLPPGKDVKFNEPTASGGYTEYMRVQLHAIAAAVDLTYELLTGDLSQVNFSSARMGMLEFRRRVSQIQRQLLIPQLCLPVWKWFTDLGFAAGALDARRNRIGVQWTTPKFEAVEPLRDAQADLLRIRTGTLTLPEAISEHGYDPEDQFNEIAAVNERMDKLKIILDSDPRKTTKAGSFQKKEEEGGSSADQSGEENPEEDDMRAFLDWMEQYGPPDFPRANGHGGRR